MAQGNYYGFVTGGVSYTATPAVTYQPEQPTYFTGATSQVSQAYPVANQVTQAYPVAAAAYETAYTTPTAYTYTVKPQVTTIAAAQVNYAPTYAYSPSTAASFDSTKVYFTQQQPLQTVQAAQQITAQHVKPISYTTSNSYSSNARPSIVKQVAVIPSYTVKTVPIAITSAPKVAAPAYVAATTASTGVASNNVTPTPTTSTYVPKQQPTTGYNANRPRWTSSGFKKNQTPGTENQWRRPKPPPKPEQLHYCDVCKISCAGPQAFQDHLTGQRHKKKEAINKSKPSGSLKCDLCNVACSSTDTYTAHIHGSKHQKVVKLYNKLGKPVPSEEEMIASLSSGDAKAGKPSTAGGEKKMLDNDEASNKPIGREYIEEVATEDGKVINIHCKLCDCHFTDPTAKEMHLKGRRHRLEYKKKVDPALVVDIKPTFHQKVLLRDKQRKMQRHFDDQRMMDMRPLHLPPQQFGEQASRLMHQGPTLDDRHVTAKHSTIYPNVTELQAIQKIVGDTEKALKLVSDEITEAEKKVKAEKPESTEEKANTKPQNAKVQRLLRGVMRVGDMAKGLLLKGDFVAELVVLCGEKPTYKILVNIADKLPKHLEASKGKYEVFKDIKNAGIRVSSKDEPKVVVNIILTSPIIRADNPAGIPDPPDVLDSTKCLDALAELRHVRWFQSCAANLQPCLMVIRIFKDLCRRIPTWATLESWPMELLVEKTIRSAGKPVSPGESVRYVFEAIASGILLPSGPGIQDPCEKDPADTTGKMSNQDREDITASAQHALRLLAFSQVHKVLNMEPLPLPNMPPKAGQKRPHDINPADKINGKKGKTEN